MSVQSQAFATVPKIVVQDPSTMHPHKLLVYVGEMLASAGSNLRRHKDKTWSIEWTRRDVNAPSRGSGTQEQICHRLARWISLRHGVPMIAGLEERMPEIIWKLAGDKVPAYKERMRLEAIEAARLAAERKARKTVKGRRAVEGRPEIYSNREGLPWIESLHGWLSLHVQNVGEGYLPVSLAVRAFVLDVEFHQDRRMEQNEVREVMETIIHSMYNKKPDQVNGTEGWVGLDMDNEATDLLFR